VKLVKMFGFAALLAVTSMALMGASTATANENTILCKVHVEGCEDLEQQVKHVHMIAKNSTLLANFVVPVTVTCEEALALVEILGLGKPQIGHFLSLLWSGCETTSGEECDVETLSPPGLVLVLKTALNLGTVQAHDTEVNVDCGALINCTYGGLPTLIAEGALHNPDHLEGVVRANNLPVEQTGGILCPPTANWHAEFLPLEKIYIVS
jgi:hypothetical protein